MVRTIKISTLLVLAACVMLGSQTFFPLQTSAAYSCGSHCLIGKPPNNLGLVGYWPMNEATSTIAGDFSGQGNRGSFSDTPLWTSGKRGSALNFDGSNDYVTITDPGTGSILDFSSGGITISAWVYIDASPGCTEGVIDKTEAQAPNYSLFFCSGKPVFEYITPLAAYHDWEATNALSTSAWHHITVSYTYGTGSSLVMYVNGVSVGGSWTQGDGNSLPFTHNEPVQIGRGGPQTGEYFDGKIDELRLYNRALGATEVAYLYNSGAARVIASSKTLTQGSSLGASGGLVGHYSFDGGDVNWTSSSAGVVYDGSGSNNIGTLTSMSRSSAPVIGKLGQALNFDGSDDYISLGLTNLPLIDGAQSVSFWFMYPSTPGASQNMFSTIDSGPDDGLNIGFHTLSDCGPGMSFGVWKWGGPFLVCTSSLPSSGNWHHLTYTSDGGTKRLYVDGIEVDNSTVDEGSGTVVTFRIGDFAGGGEYFLGKIDEVRYYNRALSAAEVLQLYRLGQAKIVP